MVAGTTEDVSPSFLIVSYSFTKLWQAPSVWMVVSSLDDLGSTWAEACLTRDRLDALSRFHVHVLHVKTGLEYQIDSIQQTLYIS